MVTYQNKKITSTYQTDYIEGKSLFKNLQKRYENEIKKTKDYKNTTIIFLKKLNQYTKLNQEKIILKDTKTLPIYEVNTELEVKNWDTKTITTTIKQYKTKLEQLKYNPKRYNIIISNKKNINQVIEIKNLTKNLIENNLNQIIDGIINNDKNINKEYNIDYQYIEEEL